MKPTLKAGLKLSQRPALLGRMRMADWIEMPEKEFAGEIEKIEKDPLFRKLFFGGEGFSSAIRRERWPASRMGEAFYELNEQLAAGGDRVNVEESLRGKSGVAAKIQKMGREAFERYFVHADEPLTLQEIAKRTGVSMDDVLAIHDFVLELGAQAEFEGPPAAAASAAPARVSACLARLTVEAGEPGFEFFSAHWARGRYQVRYDLIERFKGGAALSAEERKRLPRLLKRIETVNLRQNTLFRIIESLSRLQLAYLGSRHEEKKRPISLRQLAHRLDLAPSTVSRALSERSIKLPWDEEIALIELLPGRRRVVRRIVAAWLKEGGESLTDAVLAERLLKEFGIRVSRRTVNAVRHQIGNAKA